MDTLTDPLISIAAEAAAMAAATVVSIAVAWLSPRVGRWLGAEAEARLRDAEARHRETLESAARTAVAQFWHGVSSPENDAWRDQARAYVRMAARDAIRILGADDEAIDARIERVRQGM